MKKRLILDRELGLVVSSEDGVITVERPPVSIGDRILFAVFALIAFLMGVLALIATGSLLYGAVAGEMPIRGSIITSALSFIFLLGEIPCVLGFVAAQGFCFPFKAQINTVNGRYRFVNGIHRVTLDLRGRGRYISIKAFHSRGDWGYYASFTKGREWFRLDTVVPNLLIGSKSKALIKAKALKQFIEESVHGIEVRLEGWETKKKRKGVTHD